MSVRYGEKRKPIAHHLVLIHLKAWTTNSLSEHVSDLLTACISILGILLVAGLWPFHAPKNDVTWLTNGEGIRFGRYGAIVSTSSFLPQPDKASGSIELWLEPSVIRGTRTILSFDSSAHPGVPFSLRQDDDALIVVQDNEDKNGNSWTAWSVLKRVFYPGKPVFVTIILGPRHTSICLDGIFRKDFIIGDSWNNFTGRLVVANSPNDSNSWPGIMRGMAIYNGQLTQDEIREHYDSWIKGNRPKLLREEAPIALYLFNERAGDTAYNEVDHRTDLKIPTRYFVLHSAFLRSPWHTYHPSWSYWKDLTINIAGFVPFGFSATMYFSAVRQLKAAAPVSVLLGFFISLVIEILQAFLPTRDSGMSDLITNTLGTALGAMLYAYFGRTSWPAARLETFASRSPLHQAGAPRQ